MKKRGRDGWLMVTGRFFVFVFVLFSSETETSSTVERGDGETEEKGN
jgi:hypothetical protein